MTICTIKPDLISTCLQVVFNSSANSTSNVSLNDTGMVGKTVQSKLFAVLIRFRFHTFTISAYIEKFTAKFEYMKLINTINLATNTFFGDSILQIQLKRIN